MDWNKIYKRLVKMYLKGHDAEAHVILEEIYQTPTSMRLHVE